MTASATANSGELVASPGSYSPTHNDETAIDGESSGEVMEEAAELGVARGERSQRLEAVDHDDARTMLLDQTHRCVRAPRPGRHGARRRRDRRRTPTGRLVPVSKNASDCPKRNSLSNGSDTVERYSPGRSGVALANRHCSARIVLPVPGAPTTSVIASDMRPPPSISSSRTLPVERRCIRTTCATERRVRRAQAQQVAHRRHELQRHHRLGEERAGPGRHRLHRPGRAPTSPAPAQRHRPPTVHRARDRRPRSSARRSTGVVDVRRTVARPRSGSNATHTS